MMRVGAPALPGHLDSRFRGNDGVEVVPLRKRGTTKAGGTPALPGMRRYPGGVADSDLIEADVSRVVSMLSHVRPVSGPLLRPIRPMLLFWLLVSMMIAAALLLVVPPLLRGRGAGRDAPPGGDVSRDTNVALYRERLAALERERDLGEIDAERYAALREDLERGLLADVDTAPTGAAPAAFSAAPPRWMAAAVMLMVPACGLALYAWLGSPHALDPRAHPPRVAAGGIAPAQPGGATGTAGPVRPSDAAGGVAPAPDVAAMVDSLAAKLATDPANAEGWLLLARSRVVQERFDEAAIAYGRAHALLGDSPSLLADWAEAEAALAGNRFPARALDRLDRALEIDPGHEKALWLGGFAAIQHGRTDVARARWERLRARQAPESREASIVSELLARMDGAAPAVRPDAAGSAESDGATDSSGSAGAGAGAGKSVESAGSARTVDSGESAGTGESVEHTGSAGTVDSAEPAETTTDPADPAVPPRIVVEVSLAPDLAIALGGGEPVFVFARAPSGGGPPAAVVRTTVAALPATVVLDASNAMVPSRSLASIERAVVTARVARSGTVTRTSGDVEGVSEPVSVTGAAPVGIVLSRIVP